MAIRSAARHRPSTRPRIEDDATWRPERTSGHDEDPDRSRPSFYRQAGPRRPKDRRKSTGVSFDRFHTDHGLTGTNRSGLTPTLSIRWGKMFLDILATFVAIAVHGASMTRATTRSVILPSGSPFHGRLFIAPSLDRAAALSRKQRKFLNSTRSGQRRRVLHVVSCTDRRIAHQRNGHLGRHDPSPLATCRRDGCGRRNQVGHLAAIVTRVEIYVPASCRHSRKRRRGNQPHGC